VCNIFTMHKGLSEASSVEDIERECRSAAIGCVKCKERLLESMVQEFAPARERAQELLARPQIVRDALAAGADRCRRIAEETLGEAREALGLRGGPCDADGG
jgi:tryptophanyl-tRNA synthetase